MLRPIQKSMIGVIIDLMYVRNRRADGSFKRTRRAYNEALIRDLGDKLLRTINSDDNRDAIASALADTINMDDAEVLLGLSMPGMGDPHYDQDDELAIDDKHLPKNNVLGDGGAIGGIHGNENYVIYTFRDNATGNLLVINNDEFIRHAYNTKKYEGVGGPVEVFKISLNYDMHIDPIALGFNDDDLELPAPGGAYHVTRFDAYGSAGKAQKRAYHQPFLIEVDSRATPGIADLLLERAPRGARWMRLTSSSKGPTSQFLKQVLGIE